MMRIVIYLLGLILVVLSGCNGRSVISEIHIISTNNLYGYALAPNENRIGYDDILMYANLLRDEGKDVVLADAGNFLYGSIYVKPSQGRDALEASMMAGYDILAVDNHEFDFGGHTLLALQSTFARNPMTSANITFLGKSPFPAYRLVELPSGMKVALIGAMSVSAFDAIQQDKVNGWDFWDPVDILRDLEKDLASKADTMILLGGFNNSYDRQNLTQYILEKIPGIVLIVDAVNHGLQNIDNRLVINSPSSAEGFHHTILQFKDKKLLNSHTEIIEKKDLKKYDLNEHSSDVVSLREYLAKVQQSADEYFKHEIFNIPVTLNGSDYDVRTGETNMTHVVTDSFQYATGAQIAITNAGAIRGSLQAGPITYGDLYNVLPYGNSIVTIGVSGRDIQQAIEDSIQYLPLASSTLLHFSGLTYSYDLSRPQGSRVENIMIGDRNIDLNKIYIVAVNNFLSSGGDGYSMFVRPIIRNYGYDIDILREYITQNKQKLQYRDNKRVYNVTPMS